MEKPPSHHGLSVGNTVLNNIGSGRGGEVPLVTVRVAVALMVWRSCSCADLRAPLLCPLKQLR